MKQNTVNTNRNINIQLTGAAASGKTTILHIIGKALADAGLNVSASDEEYRFRSSDFNPHPIYDPDKRHVHISTSFPISATDKADNAIAALVSLETDLKQASRDLTRKMTQLQGTGTNHIFVHFDREIAKVEKAANDAIKALKNFQLLQTALDQLDNLPVCNVSLVQDQCRLALCTQALAESAASTEAD